MKRVDDASRPLAESESSIMSFWNRPDVTGQLHVDFERLQPIRLERGEWIRSKHWAPRTDSLAILPELVASLGELTVDCQSDAIAVDAATSLTGEQRQQVQSMAESLKPWRKGPFRLFDLTIDAEWRSYLKWDRIAPAVGDLTGCRVLDVGCGNGYYMFRVSAHNPVCVLGLDPSVPFLLQFEFLQHFVRRPNLQMELLGAEHLELFDRAFDLVLCMGILYHQKNPLQILKAIWSALKPGGKAIIESQIIPGCEPVALFPKDRYAKARNVFFVPTEVCLRHWIQRAGFREIETLSVERTTVDEQRQTPWAPFESLAHFLDPENPERTVEGYPAPHRAAVLAVR